MIIDPHRESDIKQAKMFTYTVAAGILVLFLFLAAASYLTSCSSINRLLGLKDDNFAEEATEEVIKAKTGLTIDLTPQTPED